MHGWYTVPRKQLKKNEIVSSSLPTFGGVVISDVLDGVPDDLLVVDLGVGGDLAADHDHARLGHRLAGHLAVGVLLQVGVQHGVRHLQIRG